jgi:hypothetical protein
MRSRAEPSEDQLRVKVEEKVGGGEGGNTSMVAQLANGEERGMEIGEKMAPTRGRR